MYKEETGGELLEMEKADRRDKTGRTDMGSREQGKEKKKRSEQRNQNGGVEGVF